MNLSCQDWEMEENIRYKLNEVTDVSISLNMPRSHLRWACHIVSYSNTEPNILQTQRKYIFLQSEKNCMEKDASCIKYGIADLTNLSSTAHN
jgi:hypothetical protein